MKNVFSKWWGRFAQKRVFLDYASTTPTDPAVLRLMHRIQKKHTANPSALYEEGLATRAIMRTARKQVAEIVHVQPDEVIFTASGTEADNLALMGMIRAWRENRKPHIIVSAIEHPAVLETCAFLESEGVFVTRISVDESGIIDPQAIQKALTPDTILVSIMYVNNEIGTIQPIKEVVKVVREFRHAHGRTQYGSYPYVHTDASQAPVYLSINREYLGVDLMTLDGSKIYGPKGIGALIVKKDTPLAPILYGGGQERGMRPGTEHVAAMAGFAQALGNVTANQKSESERIATLQAYFFDQLQKQYGSNMRINGSQKNRIPNNINICIPGLDAEFAVIKLDSLGIACSSASACASLKDSSGSYVIESLGPQGAECYESSLRFTLGKATTKTDIDTTIKALQKVIKK